MRLKILGSTTRLGALCAVLVAAAVPAFAQLNLPLTAAGTNLQPAPGYQLMTIGNDGPFIVTDTKRGSAATATAQSPDGAPPVGPQDIRMLVRDSQGIPELRDLQAKGTVVPTVVLRSIYRTTTLTNAKVIDVRDAYGAAYSRAKIADAIVHFESINIVPVSGAPSTAATPYKY